MFKRYFFAGLLVWLPLWATIVVIRFLLGVMDSTILLIPHRYQPEQLFGFNIPGLGIIIAVLVVLLTGLLVTNFLGRRLLNLWNALVARIPVVRSIYTGVKQILETVLSSSGNSFRQVLLVEYPRKGLWSVAFQTGHGNKKFNELLDDDMLTIFIPTTPNPTSGFLMMVPKKDAIFLDISVDDALKWVISLGVVQPGAVSSGSALTKEQTNA